MDRIFCSTDFSSAGGGPLLREFMIVGRARPEDSIPQRQHPSASGSGSDLFTGRRIGTVKFSEYLPGHCSLEWIEKKRFRFPFHPSQKDHLSFAVMFRHSNFTHREVNRNFRRIDSFPPRRRAVSRRNCRIASRKDREIEPPSPGYLDATPFAVKQISNQTPGVRNESSA